jgi:hypothetical protein
MQTFWAETRCRERDGVTLLSILPLGTWLACSLSYEYRSDSVSLNVVFCPPKRARAVTSAERLRIVPGEPAWRDVITGITETLLRQ